MPCKNFLRMVPFREICRHFIVLGKSAYGKHQTATNANRGKGGNFQKNTNRNQNDGNRENDNADNDNDVTCGDGNRRGGENDQIENYNASKRRKKDFDRIYVAVASDEEISPALACCCLPYLPCYCLYCLPCYCLPCYCLPCMEMTDL